LRTRSTASLRLRAIAWSVKALSLVLMVAAVVQVFEGRWWVAPILILAALALVVAGSVIDPGPGTGAFTARDMMEVNNSLQMVKPPDGNVLDPSENERFRGR
jgi:hypothetical protein